MKLFGKSRRQLRFNMGVKRAIFLHRPNLRACFQQRGRERPQSRSHFNDDVARFHLGQLERFPHDVAVDEEILPKKPLGRVAKLSEEVASGRGR
jgi:hypothetical protein